jgi:hypothetical protein
MTQEESQDKKCDALVEAVLKAVELKASAERFEQNWKEYHLNQKIAAYIKENVTRYDQSPYARHLSYPFASKQKRLDVEDFKKTAIQIATNLGHDIKEKNT